jgi:PhzF family phenazine biosynthesis protein
MIVGMQKSGMRIFQVDAFTQARFSGNPATVVLDAAELDDSALQAIAREYAHAETAFVLPATSADHDLRVRFFNARKEAPFVGHATIAAHAVLLQLGERSPGILRQRSGIGVIEVSATRDPGAHQAAATFGFRQSLADLSEPMPAGLISRIASALKLPTRSIHATLPVQVARKGSTRLLLPVENDAALAQLDPDFDALIALGHEAGCDGYFVFAATTATAIPTTSSRMFCPALGIREDPVSGNAHAMLASYLWKHGRIAVGTRQLIGHQGSHMGRPGEVHVTLELLHEELQAVQIGGNAVVVSAGVLEI